MKLQLGTRWRLQLLMSAVELFQVICDILVSWESNISLADLLVTQISLFQARCWHKRKAKGHGGQKKSTKKWKEKLKGVGRTSFRPRSSQSSPASRSQRSVATFLKAQHGTWYIQTEFRNSTIFRSCLFIITCMIGK